MNTDLSWQLGNNSQEDLSMNGMAEQDHKSQPETYQTDDQSQSLYSREWHPLNYNDDYDFHNSNPYFITMPAHPAQSAFQSSCASGQYAVASQTQQAVGSGLQGATSYEPAVNEMLTRSPSLPINTSFLGMWPSREFRSPMQIGCGYSQPYHPNPVEELTDIPPEILLDLSGTDWNDPQQVSALLDPLVQQRDDGLAQPQLPASTIPSWQSPASSAANRTDAGPQHQTALPPSIGDRAARSSIPFQDANTSRKYRRMIQKTVREARIRGTPYTNLHIYNTVAHMHRATVSFTTMNGRSKGRGVFKAALHPWHGSLVRGEGAYQKFRFEYNTFAPVGPPKPMAEKVLRFDTGELEDDMSDDTSDMFDTIETVPSIVHDLDRESSLVGAAGLPDGCTDVNSSTEAISARSHHDTRLAQPNNSKQVFPTNATLHDHMLSEQNHRMEVLASMPLSRAGGPIRGLMDQDETARSQAPAQAFGLPSQLPSQTATVTTPKQSKARSKAKAQTNPVKLTTSCGKNHPAQAGPAGQKRVSKSQKTAVSTSRKTRNTNQTGRISKLASRKVKPPAGALQMQRLQGFLVPIEGETGYKEQSFHEYQSRATPSNVDFTTLGDIELSAEEILCFAPGMIKWHQCMDRFLQNGWVQRDIAHVINASRELWADTGALKPNSLLKTVQTAERAVHDQTWKDEVRPKQGVHVFSVGHWTPNPHNLGDVENQMMNYPLQALTDGLRFYPGPQGRHILTMTIEYAKTHHPDAMVSDVPAIAREIFPNGFPPLPSSGGNPDQEALVRLRNVIEESAKKIRADADRKKSRGIKVSWN